MKVWLKATVLIGLLGLAACATKPPVTEKQRDRDKPYPKSPAPEIEPAIDLKLVQDRLNMNRSSQELGFEQKRFNACDLGISKTQCQDQYLVAVHFQIMCRDSTGTVESVNSWAFEPLQSSYIYWRLQPRRGRIRTDKSGYGQVLTSIPTTIRPKSLILISGSKSLQIGLDGVRKIVVPKDWCERR